MSRQEDLKSIYKDMEHAILKIHRLCDEFAKGPESENKAENSDFTITHLARVLTPISEHKFSR